MVEIDPLPRNKRHKARLYLGMAALSKPPNPAAVRQVTSRSILSISGAMSVVKQDSQIRSSVRGLSSPSEKQTLARASERLAIQLSFILPDL
jgi:hypothetical protein